MNHNKEKNNFFGKGTEKLFEKEWNWETFTTTKEFPVSPKLFDWLIGQDKAVLETKLCVDEWINKLKYLNGKKWFKEFEEPNKEKPQPKDWLPPGPFMLLLGDVGTGKSLLGRAMASYMTEKYEEEGIKLYDVLCWKNKLLPSEPKVSIHLEPQGKKLLRLEKLKQMRRQFLKKTLFRILQVIMLGTGIILVGIFFYYFGSAIWLWITNGPFGLWEKPVQTVYEGNFIDFLISSILGVTNILIAGGSLIFFSLMIQWVNKIFGGQSGAQGIGGAEAADTPKLIVDNSKGVAPFIDATGHASAQLFGSIAWDPYQTGGLGTPEHQRVSAGDVHRANLGVLYIDETKNLGAQEAVTLLTVLEDGQLPITLRSSFHGSETSAMAVSTEPVPCMSFFIAAGNMDAIRMIHPALMDRIQGYGKVVYMKTDMLDTITNRRKYVQFIAQEIKRFNLLPFSREAVIKIIDEARRRSNKNDKLTCKFRPMISIIKTASILALNKKLNYVEKEQVEEAIHDHCKTIQQQVLERNVELQNIYRLINPRAKPIKGQIHGLAITEYDNDCIGSICPIRASIEPSKKSKEGYFKVTGVTEKKGSWVQNSIAKVRHIMIQLYKVDPESQKTHIDFAQELGIDGPSAGIAMLLSLISAYTGKKLEQNVAVTGEINIGINNEVLITPVGGINEKILAAEKMGFDLVIIPTKNYEKDIVISDYKIKIIGASTLNEYLKEVFEK